MSSNTNSHHNPEIQALMEAVEKRFEHRPDTSTLFIALSYAIESATGQHLSTSTLKRLWGYVNDAPAPRVSTLDILAQYVGEHTFRSFYNRLKVGKEDSSAFFKTAFIEPEKLKVGEQVEIGWAPDRLVRIAYLGNRRFKVVSARNAKLLPDDEFETASLMTGYPLCLSGVLRHGEWTTPFVAGKNGGLTIVRKV